MGCTLSPPANTTEPSVCGGDAALCQITLTTCYYYTELVTGAVGAVVVQSESMVTAARKAADGVSTPTVHTQRRKQPALVDICRTYVRNKYTSLFTKEVAKITKQTSTVILKNKENLTMRELY